MDLGDRHNLQYLDQRDLRSGIICRGGPNGITWTSQTSPAATWNGVSYGAGIYVAVGGAGAVMKAGP